MNIYDYIEERAFCEGYMLAQREFGFPGGENKNAINYEAIKTKEGKYYVTLTGVTIDNVTEELILNTLYESDDHGNSSDYTVNCISERLLDQYKK